MMRRAIFCMAFLAAACGGDKTASDDAAPGAGGPAEGQTGAMGNASIAGKVAFSGTAPANPAIDMSEEAACKAKHPQGVTDPQIVVNDGMLGNVFVYVKSGIAAGQSYSAPSSPAVIDQDGCIYKPRVFGVMVGQNLEIKNSDPLLHNIKAVPTENRGFNISQPTQGMTTTRTFNTREVMVPLECNVHGWMNAYVGVLDHPFFATSDAGGSFKISGLPAGTYEIEAWHEKLGTQTMSVTVGADEAKSADFTFGPKAS
ncbi:MAG: carboxypeptidase regulatory-like domain-containing protein [Gemmatimonadaceae bacterium]